jgi:hypothetical protein
MEPDALEAGKGNGDSYLDSASIYGALAGGTVGGLAAIGLAPLIIPVAGPVITGGVLVALAAEIFGGAVAGGFVGSLIGGLIGERLSEDDSRYYHEEVTSGRTLLTVKVGDRVDLASAILRRHGAGDVHVVGARTTLVGQDQV